MPAARPQKITFGEMRDEMSVRGVLVYCADHRCGHSVALSADRWPEEWPLNRAFTISASLCSAYLLAMGLICMAQGGFRRLALEGEIALGVARPASSNTGVHALDLVYQAAGVFRSIEDRARETEARAEAAERGQRELIAVTERKLSDASKALEEAQKRIEAQQDRLSAIEYRAQVAEADARDAKQTLALVEEAIRRRLLFTSEETGRLDTAGPGASGESQEPDAPGEAT